MVLGNVKDIKQCLLTVFYEIQAFKKIDKSF
jgi:hypothetical protein